MITPYYPKINPLILIAGTCIIILFSWFLSIKHKRYHGIARFFSFESIFILVYLNLNIWFKDPFAPFQIISWLLFLLSVYIAVAGFLLLRKIGKPDANFENTSVLVKESLYKYIRHPLYLSLFIFGTGIVIKHPGPVQLIFGFVNLVALYITARMEEKEMIARFGKEYQDYMKETKMFIPFIL
jgi:protein-S-isoprenylcysteine O-methyltransferase Ste14